MTAADAGKRRPNELLLRVATAAAGIPALLLVNWAGGLLFTLVAAGVLALATTEICRAAAMARGDVLAWTAAAGAGACAIAAAQSPQGPLAAMALTVALTLAIVVFRAETEHGFARWTAAIGAVAYTGILGCHLVLLRELTDGARWVGLALFTTFAADTGAFFTGRAIGGRKLAPHVSPGKTISGAVGGLVSACAAAVTLGAILSLDGELPAHAALGFVAAACSITGDLAESLVKRSLGVKDMGHLFPGHGGVMDRLDSILFVAPVVYYVARWIIE